MISIPSTNFFIDENLSITDKDGIRCCNTDSNLITLPLFGKERTVDKLWLYLFSKYKIGNEHTVDFVVFTPLAENARYKHDKFNYYVSFMRPVYYGQDHNLRIVPRFPNIAISKDGKIVKNIFTGHVVSTYINPYGYVSATIHDETCNCKRNVFIHRLVANAWCVNKDPYFKTTVNHKNGIKTDNNASNLEWASFKENDQHAASTGLKRSSKCKIRDIVTGDIKEFVSTAEAFRYIGINNQEEVHFNRRINSLFNKRYEMRLDGDHRPWFYNTNVSNVCAAQYIYTIEDDTGAITIVNGIKEFITKYKLWNIPDNNKSLVNEFKRRYPNYKITVLNQRPHKQIQIRDLKSNKITLFESEREASKNLSICRTTIRHSIKSDGKFLVNGQYQARFISKKKWPEPYIKENKPQQILVINKTTNEEVTYESLRAVAAALGLSRFAIKRRIKNPYLDDKYQFVLVNTDV